MSEHGVVDPPEFAALKLLNRLCEAYAAWQRSEFFSGSADTQRRLQLAYLNLRNQAIVAMTDAESRYTITDAGRAALKGTTE